MIQCARQQRNANEYSYSIRSLADVYLEKIEYCGYRHAAQSSIGGLFISVEFC